DGYGDAEDDPLRLLALRRGRAAAIAVDLCQRAANKGDGREKDASLCQPCGKGVKREQRERRYQRDAEDSWRANPSRREPGGRKEKEHKQEQRASRRVKREHERSPQRRRAAEHIS